MPLKIIRNKYKKEGPLLKNSYQMRAFFSFAAPQNIYKVKKNIKKSSS